VKDDAAFSGLEEVREIAARMKGGSA